MSPLKISFHVPSIDNITLFVLGNDGDQCLLMEMKSNDALHGAFLSHGDCIQFTGDIQFDPRYAVYALRILLLIFVFRDLGPVNRFKDGPMSVGIEFRSGKVAFDEDTGSQAIPGIQAQFPDHLFVLGDVVGMSQFRDIPIRIQATGIVFTPDGRRNGFLVGRFVEAPLVDRLEVRLKSNGGSLFPDVPR